MNPSHTMPSHPLAPVMEAQGHHDDIERLLKACEELCFVGEEIKDLERAVQQNDSKLESLRITECTLIEDLKEIREELKTLTARATKPGCHNGLELSQMLSKIQELRIAYSSRNQMVQQIARRFRLVRDANRGLMNLLQTACSRMDQLIGSTGLEPGPAADQKKMLEAKLIQSRIRAREGEPGSLD